VTGIKLFVNGTDLIFTDSQIRLFSWFIVYKLPHVANANEDSMSVPDTYNLDFCGSQTTCYLRDNQTSASLL